MAERKPSLLQTIRGLVFVTLAYGLMLVMGILLVLPSWASRRFALASIKFYIHIGLFLLRVICGTRYEIRGPVPTNACIIASKHQSFLDVWLLCIALPTPRFVMKKSLLYMPVVGIYANRLGSIAIDREAGGKAVRALERGVADGIDNGQTIIFPQGTRAAPDAKLPYKPGVLRLYRKFGLPLELAATNCGCFWPRFGVWRAPGTAVLEFVGSIPPGKDRAEVIGEVEQRIEGASDLLVSQARS